MRIGGIYPRDLAEDLPKNLPTNLLKILGEKLNCPHVRIIQKNPLLAQ